MPLETVLLMRLTAFFTSAAASADFASTALRAFFTAVRSEPIAARLRVRFLIILRFCFCADLMLATELPLRTRREIPPGTGVYPRPGGGVNLGQPVGPRRSRGPRSVQALVSAQATTGRGPRTTPGHPGQPPGG